jgi:diguanylate cyclase (GGDEF)-like protein
MKALKNLIPIVLLLMLGLYSFQQYDYLPDTIKNIAKFLLIVLSSTVFILSFHFNRSHIFFFSLLISFNYIVLGLELATSSMAYSLLSLLTPIVMAILALLPERGILSVRAMPSHLVIVFALGFAMVMIMTTPWWMHYLLNNDWLPARYFDWTQQSQSIIFVAITLMITLLIRFFLQPSPQTAAALGIFTVLTIQLHFGYDKVSLYVFSTAAFLMCLYAILQESWRMAYLDELTELPGRRALKEKFQKIGGMYTVAMLDVDHFKKFNDTYGHDTGDAVLRMIAAKLRKISGKGSVYRYGGEEFSVVFNGKDVDQATPHLEQLRETIASTPFVVNRASRRKGDRKPKRTGSKTVQVTVSIGVADSNDDVASAWGVLKNADKALYKAKGAGRNCVSS